MLSRHNAAMRTASELLAASHGTPCSGDLACFYCGSPASDIPLVLSSSFCDWWQVAHPSSAVICRGCEIALDEKVPMVGRDKPQKTRNWSWLITSTRAVPLGDIAAIRLACLAPPEPPWALAIAVSGQKHVIFRTPANLGCDPCSVQLESQTVVYRLGDLHARLALAKRICGASGKPALTGRLDAGLALRLFDAVSESDIHDWFSRAVEPINQLAAHICPPKSECNERSEAA
jgi:CRISPR type IV-associated protein Csf1